MAKSLELDGETEREGGRGRLGILKGERLGTWENFSSKCGLFRI